MRQGENISPVLFAIYLNDFELFVSRRYKGLSKLSSDAETYLSDDDVMVFLHLDVLLYADDTIVMAESSGELQKVLNALYDYCDNWKLTVNTEKTKIVIFSRGKVRSHPVFLFGTNPIEVINSYVYLGVMFNYNNNFKNHLSRQIKLARSVRDLYIP